MAVAAGDPAVLVVNAKLGPLIAADRAAAIDGLALRLVVAARAARAAALDVPAPVRVRYDMVGLRSSTHTSCPSSLRLSAPRSHLRLDPQNYL